MVAASNTIPVHVGGMSQSKRSSSSLIGFPAAISILIALFGWPTRWLVSGAPILTYCLIVGGEDRILNFIPLWTLITLINLTYLLAATSWLFYWVFTVACYPIIFISCLFQFELVARYVRYALRLLVNNLHFTNDNIAFFDIPALEIDTEVEGLVVVRGITLSLSRLSLIAHGVEVGIKLSEDTELAIQVDEVKVLLFRRIDIGDVYANLKGGKHEMTFGNLARRATGDSLLVSDTPLLEAAALKGKTTRPDLSRVASRLTNGAEPQQVSVKAGLGSLTQISPVDDEAVQRYHKALSHIHETSSIQECMQVIEQESSETTSLNTEETRAHICSQLHGNPSVPHPPLQSIKVTTLRSLTRPSVRRFLHRLPFLLRLLLTPLSYFHPVSINSITAAGSGKWLQSTLREKIFKHYGEQDAGIRKLESRVSTWLSDANFVLELLKFTADARIPLIPSFNIITQFKTEGIVVYRTQPTEIELTEAVRLGGADASIGIPAFLLPHHEHLLPPIPNYADERYLQAKVQKAENKPEEVKAQVELKQSRKDETNLKLAVRASLPAVFDQELLDFAAALVKAVKIIEMKEDPEPDDSDSLYPSSLRGLKDGFKDGFKDARAALSSNVLEGMKRAGVDTVLHDKWIAKMVGKVTKKLENARGDVGYSGDVPIALVPYRRAGAKDVKLLP